MESAASDQHPLSVPIPSWRLLAETVPGSERCHRWRERGVCGRPGSSSKSGLYMHLHFFGPATRRNTTDAHTPSCNHQAASKPCRASRPRGRPGQTQRGSTSLSSTIRALSECQSLSLLSWVTRGGAGQSTRALRVSGRGPVGLASHAQNGEAEGQEAEHDQVR